MCMMAEAPGVHGLRGPHMHTYVCWSARTDGNERGVEEEEHAEGDEEEAQAQQAHADLLVVVKHGC